MKITEHQASEVGVELTFIEAIALYKIAMSADLRTLNLEWPTDFEDIESLVGALQVQLSAVVGP